MITTITGKNQVTLPAEVVRSLDLTPGTQLDWEIVPNGTLIATPRPTRARLAAALMGAERTYRRHPVVTRRWPLPYDVREVAVDAAGERVYLVAGGEGLVVGALSALAR